MVKLKTKTGVGGRIHRVCEEPRTQYQRLLASGQINHDQPQGGGPTAGDLPLPQLGRAVGFGYIVR